MSKKPFNVLFIGNSYSECTCAYVYDFLTAMGITEHNIASLKLSGCTINMHWNNAQADDPAYLFFHYTTSGDRTDVPSVRLSEGIPTDQWDWVIFSEGTAGAAYPASYANFQALIDYVKPMTTPGRTKFAFNMTWPWEDGSPKFTNDQFQNRSEVMFQSFCSTVQSIVQPNPDIDLILPTGTAVYNAVRDRRAPALYRDGGHLNANGCFLAGLAALYALLSHTEGYEQYTIGRYGIPCLPTDTHRTNGSFKGELDASYADVYLEAVSAALEKPFE